TVVAHDDDYGIGGGRVVNEPAVVTAAGHAGFDQQPPEFGVERFGHVILNDAPGHRGLAIDAVEHGAVMAGNEIAGRLLPGCMGRAIADGGHPWPVARAGLDPVDGGVGFDAGAIAARPRIGERYFFDVTVFNNDERWNVTGMRAVSVER